MGPSDDNANNAGDEKPGRHLYFDDRAAMVWYRSLAAAQAAAAGAGKRVLIIVGRRDCGGTRALIEKIFPKEEITDELRAGFVCVCSEEASPEPAVAALRAAAPRREPTPLCLYCDASGRLLHSTVGGRPTAVFLRDLTKTHAQH